MARRSPDREHAVREHDVREHLVREVVPRFGFAASEIESVERIPQRLKNVNYRVRAGGADWVLKRYMPTFAPARLAFAHAIQLQLAEHDFPLAPLRPALGGRTLVSDETGSYSMHGWVEGLQISIGQRDDVAAERPDMVAELGAMLGRLHLLTSSMELPTVSYADPDLLLQAPRRSLTSIRRGRPPDVLKGFRLRLRPRKSELDRWILAHMPALREHADRLADASIAARLDPADVVVSHHDINWENLIFGESFRLRALLDFDNATRMQRDLDVGLAAAVLVGHDQERLKVFLKAYGDAAKHQVDQSVVELGIQLKCARSILWSIDAYLSGRVGSPEMLATWVSHLYESLDRLPRDRGDRMGMLAIVTLALTDAETVGAALLS